jgi:O-antigen ligase
MDNFLYRYPTYLPAGLAVEPNLSHPHNLILHFWLQLGLLGLAAAAWLLVQFVRRVWPYARSAQAQPAKALAVGSLGSMTDFVAHGMVDNSYFLVDMAFIFWMTLALSLTLTRSKAGDRPPDS